MTLTDRDLRMPEETTVWTGLEPIIAKILLYRGIYNHQNARVNHLTAYIFPP